MRYRFGMNNMLRYKRPMVIAAPHKVYNVQAKSQ